jgi:hypothetical protein
MIVCSIGDWIKDIQTSDVYEVVGKKVDIFTDWYELVKKLDGHDKCIVTRQIKTSINSSSLQSYFVDASVARVLYSNNSNKAVTNETNEEQTNRRSY